MKQFIKDIGFYFLIMMIILFLIGYQGFELSEINKKGVNPVFNKKVEYFGKFIKEKKSSNLILGSSMIEDSIIPDSLGNNWFSFANGLQNIYNSYNFLKFYQDLIKIDTIIIGIQPFDFPYSYIKNRKDYLPVNNMDFNIFGYDSINNKKNIFYEKIQNYKNHFFPNLTSMMLTRAGFLSHDVWTKQGFSGRINQPIKNLDSLYENQSKNERQAYTYFYNVNKNPKMKHFDLFNDLAKSLNIKVIYLLTPKSKYYHLDLAKYEFDSIWNNILGNMEIRNIQIWNYEKMDTGNFKVNWFWDDVHSSYDGAKAFTKIIRKRLRD